MFSLELSLSSRWVFILFLNFSPVFFPIKILYRSVAQPKGGGGGIRQLPNTLKFSAQWFLEMMFIAQHWKFRHNCGFWNSVEFSKISHSLIELRRTECSLTDDKVFFYLPSAFPSKHMYSTNNQSWIRNLDITYWKLITLKEYNMRQ